MSKTINVIVVDDSAFMRKSLSMMLESDPMIKVVATARDGREGIEKIKAFKPDLVTMDIEMPGMDGLTALGIIMKEMPLPVLMISSLTTEGAQSTLEALSRGAVDFIPKELSYVSLDIVKIKEELVTKVKEIVQSRSLTFRLQRIRSSAQGVQGVGPKPLPVQQHFVKKSERKDYRAVVVGISTGGPMALLQTIPKIPAGFPVGIAVVQHMPPHFTKSMADRLNGLSAIEVHEAVDGEPLEPATVLIAPGGRHMTFERSGGQVRVRVSDEPKNTLYHPSADIMIQSAVNVVNAPMVGLIMTGMGKDGLEGLRDVKKKGGYIIAQDEETCVVYGMPKAVVEDGIADAVVPLNDIPKTLTQVFV